MGYFNGLAASAFKTDEQGNHYVFPFGVMGKGRRFRNRQDFEKARGTLVGAYVVGAVILISGGVARTWFGWGALGVTLGVLLLGSILVMALITRNTEKVDVRDSLADNMARAGQAHGPAVLALLIGTCALFTAGGVFLITIGKPIGYAAAGFFGLGTIMLTTMLISGRKARR